MASNYSMTISTSTQLEKTNKDLILLRDGEGCWSCGFTGEAALNYCHVIPKNQSHQVSCLLIFEMYIYIILTSFYSSTDTKIMDTFLPKFI